MKWNISLKAYTIIETKDLHYNCLVFWFRQNTEWLQIDITQNIELPKLGRICNKFTFVYNNLKSEFQIAGYQSVT